MNKIRLGVLGSSRGTDLQAIIDAINEDHLNASLEVVISNVSDAYILTRAAKYKIPSRFISHVGKNRELFDSEISEVLRGFEVDLILLIGFMRILTTKFCQEWEGKIMNVHPSLLPKYAGGMDTNVHEKVIKNGDKDTGCTIHYVTADVDRGPIVVQKKCLVFQNDTPYSLKNRVQKLEGEAFIEAIQKFTG